MRRTTILLPVVAVALLGLITAGRTGPLAVAQEGSPPAGGFEIAPGVTAEALAFAAGEEDPSLYRLTFAPGATYAVMDSREIDLVYAESGSLRATLDAPVTVARAGATDAPGEAIAPGTEFTVEAGDYAVLPPLVGGEVRNDGQEDASVLVAAIIPPDAPPTAATPAA